MNIVRSCLGWDNTLCQPTPRLEERFQAKFEESSFVIFEELEFRGKNREKLMEPMKDLITNEGKKQKQYKGVDFIGIREFFNVCITSNHKDALKLNTKTVRRVFPLQILPSSNQQHPELCNRLEKELKKRGQSMNARTIRDWFIQELVPYSKENSPQNEIRQLRDYLMNLPGAQDVEKVKSRLVEQTQNEAAQRATKEELARRETAETTDMLIEMGIPLVNKHFVSEGALMKELWNHHPHLRGSKELSSHTVRNDLQERGYTRFHEIRGIKVPLDEYNFTIKNEQSRNEAFEKYKGECVVRKKTIRVQASSNTNFSESKWRDDINEYNGRGGYGFLVIGADKVEDKPTDKVEDKPTDKVEDKPTDKVEDKPTDKVEDKPTDKVEDKPTDKVEDKPTDKVEDKPTDKYAKKRKRKTQPTEKITVLPLSRDKEMDKELDSNPTLR